MQVFQKDTARYKDEKLKEKTTLKELLKDKQFEDRVKDIKNKWVVGVTDNRLHEEINKSK